MKIASAIICGLLAAGTSTAFARMPLTASTRDVANEPTAIVLMETSEK